jgi:hypothetical protein
VAGTKKVTNGVRNYIRMFDLAIAKGDVAFEDVKDKNSYSVVAQAGDYIITARDTNQNGITDYLKVERKNMAGKALVVEITGTPGMFEDVMENLVSNTRLALTKKKSKIILENVK